MLVFLEGISTGIKKGINTLYFTTMHLCKETFKEELYYSYILHRFSEIIEGDALFNCFCETDTTQLEPRTFQEKKLNPLKNKNTVTKFIVNTLRKDLFNE